MIFRPDMFLSNAGKIISSIRADAWETGSFQKSNGFPGLSK